MSKPTEETIPSQAELLIRHRWMGNVLKQHYRCTPQFPSLYKSPDPLCFGCGAELLWADIPDLKKFRGVANDRLLGEALGVRLDLRFCELRMR